MSTISGSDYLTTGVYITDITTLKAKATELRDLAYALFPNGTFYDDLYQLTGGLKDDIDAKCTEIKALCDAVKAKEASMAGFLVAIRTT